MKQKVQDDQRVFNNTRAFSEGWGLFNDGEIQYLNDGPCRGKKQEQTGKPAFKSDQGAIDFVKKQAKAGSRYHRRALALQGEWLRNRPYTIAQVMANLKLFAGICALPLPGKKAHPKDIAIGLRNAELSLAEIQAISCNIIKRGIAP